MLIINNHIIRNGDDYLIVNTMIKLSKRAEDRRLADAPPGFGGPTHQIIKGFELIKSQKNKKKSRCTSPSHQVISSKQTKESPKPRVEPEFPPGLPTIYLDEPEYPPGLFNFPSSPSVSDLNTACLASSPDSVGLPPGLESYISSKAIDSSLPPGLNDFIMSSNQKTKPIPIPGSGFYRSAMPFQMPKSRSARRARSAPVFQIPPDHSM